jgi:hypothetical protein
MNKRIKLLAEQAGMRTVTYENDPDMYFTDNLDVEKFTSLLLNECGTIIDKIDSGRREAFHRADGTQVHTSATLKTWFGVDDEKQIY